MEPSSELEISSKDLLDLPVEIIQLFLLNATTPTFLQAVYSCRTLYDTALQCREVLIHHLDRVPGFMWGLGLREITPETDNNELFLLLRRRACAHLYGANFSAEKTTFSFPDAQSGGVGDVKVSASSLAPHNELNTVLVRRGGGDGNLSDSVYLYDVRGCIANLRGMLKPPYRDPGKVEVLKTVCSSPRLVSVLQRYTPSSTFDQDVRKESANRKRLMRPFRQEGIHLVHYKLQSGPHDVEEVPTFCAFPNHPDHIPLALAVANERMFAISWEHAEDPNSHEVILYVIEDDEMEDESNLVAGARYLGCSGVMVVTSEGTVPDEVQSNRIGYQPTNFANLALKTSPVTHIKFGDQDNQLLYCYGASPLYERYQNLEYTAIDEFQVSGLLENTCHVRFTQRINLRFAIDLPFFGTHEAPAPGSPLNVCTWKYLSLGVATHRKEGWTVACLLKSQTTCRSNHCGHTLNLKRGRRFGLWQVVARLWGYRKPNNSIGGIVATSSGGTRIAIANWDVIYVWALEPNEIIEENVGGYYRSPYASPRSSSSSFSSPSPASNTGEGTERARNKSTAVDEAWEEMVELKPIVLPLGAVCFKLEFVPGQEDDLVALTDRGVMSWYLGPSGKGGRDWTDTLSVEPNDSEDESEDESMDESEDRGEDESMDESMDESEDESEDESASKSEVEEEAEGQPAQKKKWRNSRLGRSSMLRAAGRWCRSIS